MSLTTITIMNTLKEKELLYGGILGGRKWMYTFSRSMELISCSILHCLRNIIVHAAVVQMYFALYLKSKCYEPKRNEENTKGKFPLGVKEYNRQNENRTTPENKIVFPGSTIKNVLLTKCIRVMVKIEERFVIRGNVSKNISKAIHSTHPATLSKSNSEGTSNSSGEKKSSKTSSNTRSSNRSRENRSSTCSRVRNSSTSSAATTDSGKFSRSIDHAVESLRLPMGKRILTNTRNSAIELRLACNKFPPRAVEPIPLHVNKHNYPKKRQIGGGVRRVLPRRQYVRVSLGQESQHSKITVPDDQSRSSSSTSCLTKAVDFLLGLSTPSCAKSDFDLISMISRMLENCHIDETISHDYQEEDHLQADKQDPTGNISAPEDLSEISRSSSMTSCLSDAKYFLLGLSTPSCTNPDFDFRGMISTMLEKNQIDESMSHDHQEKEDHLKIDKQHERSLSTSSFFSLDFLVGMRTPSDTPSYLDKRSLIGRIIDEYLKAQLNPSGTTTKSLGKNGEKQKRRYKQIIKEFKTLLNSYSKKCRSNSKSISGSPSASSMASIGLLSSTGSRSPSGYSSDPSPIVINISCSSLASSAFPMIVIPPLKRKSKHRDSNSLSRKDLSKSRSKKSNSSISRPSSITTINSSSSSSTSGSSNGKKLRRSYKCSSSSSPSKSVTSNTSRSSSSTSNPSKLSKTSKGRRKSCEISSSSSRSRKTSQSSSPTCSSRRSCSLSESECCSSCVSTVNSRTSCDDPLPTESDFRRLASKYPGYLSTTKNIAVVVSKSGDYNNISTLVAKGLQTVDRILITVPWGSYILFKSHGSYFLHKGCTCHLNRFRHLDLSVGTQGLIHFMELNESIQFIANENCQPIEKQKICS